MIDPLAALLADYFVRPPLYTCPTTIFPSASSIPAWAD
jgi:hypothetical protein